MKRLGVMLFTLVLSVSLAAIAQEAGKQQPAGSTTTSTTKTKLQHLTGKISDDGKSFTTDKDNKTYTIDNSDAVKGNEGHDVRLSGHVDASNDSIHVTSVTMASEKKPMSEQPPK